MKPVQLSCNLRYWIKSKDWFCHKITYTGIHWMKILSLQPKPHLNHCLKSKLCVFKWNTDNMSFESTWEWQFLEGKANLYKTELEKKKSKTIKPIYTQTGFSWQPCFLAMRGVGENCSVSIVCHFSLFSPWKFQSVHIPSFISQYNFFGIHSHR